MSAISTLPQTSTDGTWEVQLPLTLSFAEENITTDNQGFRWFRGTASATRSCTAFYTDERSFAHSPVSTTRRAAKRLVRRVLHTHSSRSSCNGASSSASSET